MSKAAKQSILILIVLLIASLGFTGYTLFEKQKVEQSKQSLQTELTASQEREKKYIQQTKQLEEEQKKALDENASLKRKLKTAEDEARDLRSKAEEIAQDRDKFKGRVENITKERDQLMEKVQELQSNGTKTVAAPAPSSTPAIAAATPSQADGIKTEGVTEDESHWAGVLKQKAALEVQVQDMKEQLSQKAIEIVELKQKNTGMGLELDELRAQKDEIERTIKYKEDLVNNLSLELARTKNDKKFVADRVESMSKENAELRQELKTLASSKTALEKTIVRINDDKKQVEKKLMETENVIQSKIDEIWDIKESLDQTFKQSRGTKTGGSEVELPPIVVKSQAGVADISKYAPQPTATFNGQVVSVNKNNNFVIVNIGEDAGVTQGSVLSVYRDSKYIARLEVIQTRKDISAADIKDQWTPIEVGDTVR